MEKRLYIKEPGSAITHFIGMIMAIIAAIPLLYRAAREPSKLYIVSLTIYAASLSCFMRQVPLITHLIFPRK